jgi:hypothetical protein
VDGVPEASLTGTHWHSTASLVLAADSEDVAIILTSALPQSLVHCRTTRNSSALQKGSRDLALDMSWRPDMYDSIMRLVVCCAPS